MRLDGKLITRVDAARANQMVGDCHGEWRGRGPRAYIAVTTTTMSALVDAIRSPGTIAVRADASCRDHESGQIIGKDKLWEFKRQGERK